ncbi:transglycosylase domain-containing protein [Bacillus litorisediminis]|uniref:transglycosylase domain-containing protein n=1 Tax=Bacillus litorisediminis TaxID=2922713 RepID=UPI001FAF4043|nr:transglycosylase domain-containing protein [Bacillus litorisediminis]
MEILTGNHFEKTKKYARALFFLSLLATIIGFIMVSAVFIYAKVLGPPPLVVPKSSLFLADNGEIFGATNPQGEIRHWVSLHDITEDVQKATISIEDRNFYEHHGFDLKRIAGAALADIQAMAKVQGASTITQQYARNLFLEHDKTWKRKLKEAFYALRLEMNYTKEEILEGYLNTIYYGHGAYGIQAASQFYFGKDADKLSLAEAAMLTGIPKGPSHYSPIINFSKAKDRQELILDEMTETGAITKAQADAAKAEKLTLIGEHPHVQNDFAPYFQDIVRHELIHKLKISEEAIALGGLTIYTTIDPKLQEIAEKAVTQNMSDESNIQVGFVAMDPETGFVKALIGGRDYQESTYNRAYQALRQPGSTIKPLLYYAALERGFTPSTTMRSEMTTFKYDEGRSEYTPHNFNNHYAEDEITLAQALALSDNVYAVKTHLFLGEDVLVDTAKQFGIKSKMEQVPSLALGTSGVRVVEMVNAYSLFANGGRKVEPTFIKKVVNEKGEILYESKLENEQVLDPDITFVMSSLLRGMFDPKLNDYTSVTGSSIINEMTRAYAGKSGSTDTDSWMIGFTPQLTAGVWTGYDEGKEITLTTEKMHAKNIWIDFMEKALEDEPVRTFIPTDGVVGVYVNPDNGKLATESCPVARYTYFVKGTEPTTYCTEHIKEPLDDHEPKPSEEKLPGGKDKPWYKKLLEWWG